MKIEVHLYAGLLQYLPHEKRGRSITMEIREDATVQELLQTFNIPHGAVKLIFLNGTHARVDSVLKNGDRLGLFPAVGGG